MRLAAAAVALAAALGAAVWFAWRRPAPPVLVSRSCAGCNVLLVTIDTLRLDRVGAFGGTRHLTPTLDRLAREGLMLTRAYASAPLTLPSHASILTAVSPPVHGVRTNGLFRLGPRRPTLATVLQAAGYRTGAFVGAFVLDARFGLTRGFDVYDDRYGEKHEGDPTEGAERRAEEVVKPALAWIARQPAGRTQPWFAWVHLYDPHEPYRAPEPWASQYEPYDAEVAYTDAIVGRLVDQLRAASRLASTLIVVTADHGESLGEHDETTHGTFVYDVTMRVPWMMWSASGGVHGAYGGLVRLIDLAPTVLDLVGVAAPPEFEGESLVPAVQASRRGIWLHADAAADRTAYVEAMDANLTRNWAPVTAVVAGQWKFIDLPVPELYDLSADPGERTNIYGRERARARVLESLLGGLRSTLETRAAGAARLTLDSEARQRLRALGYAAAAADSRQRVYAEADDPKRLITAWNDLRGAARLFESGSRADAMAAVRAIQRAHPGFVTAAVELSSMQRRTGDLSAAIATLEEVVRHGTADPSDMVLLAGYLQEAGALDRAAGLLDAVIVAHADYAEAYNSIGVVYSRLGRHDRARAAFAKVLELDPTSAIAYENLGVDKMSAGDLDAASADLTRALELDPQLAGAHNVLGTLDMRRHRPAEAIAHWQQAVQANPRLYDALFNLAGALHQRGRRDEARPYLERFASEAPPDRYAREIAMFKMWLGKEEAR